MCVVSSADVRAHAVTMFMPEIVTVLVNGRLCDISTIAAATTVSAGALSGTIGFAGAPRTSHTKRRDPLPYKLGGALDHCIAPLEVVLGVHCKDTAMPAQMLSIFAI